MVNRVPTIVVRVSVDRIHPITVCRTPHPAVCRPGDIMRDSHQPAEQPFRDMHRVWITLAPHRRLKHALTNQPMTIGEGRVQVGRTKVDPPFLLDRIVGVSPFRRMLLHLPSGQLGMHGLRDDNRLITEFSAADMMLLCRPVAPMLESKRDVTF